MLLTVLENIDIIAISNGQVKSRHAKSSYNDRLLFALGKTNCNLNQFVVKIWRLNSTGLNFWPQLPTMLVSPQSLLLTPGLFVDRGAAGWSGWSCWILHGTFSNCMLWVPGVDNRRISIVYHQTKQTSRKANGQKYNSSSDHEILILKLRS